MCVSRHTTTIDQNNRAETGRVQFGKRTKVVADENARSVTAKKRAKLSAQQKGRSAAFDDRAEFGRQFLGM